MRLFRSLFLTVSTYQRVLAIIPKASAGRQSVENVDGQLFHPEEPILPLETELTTGPKDASKSLSERWGFKLEDEQQGAPSGVKGPDKPRTSSKGGKGSTQGSKSRKTIASTSNKLTASKQQHLASQLHPEAAPFNPSYLHPHHNAHAQHNVAPHYYPSPMQPVQDNTLNLNNYQPGQGNLIDPHPLQYYQVPPSLGDGRPMYIQYPQGYWP